MNQPKQTLRDVRRINRTTILQYLYFSSPISRLEISQRSGLSPATVTSVVAELLDEGIVTEFGLEESRGGRPRTTLVMNSIYGYFIGIDVGETHIQMELFDLTLHKLSDARYILSANENQPENLIDHIVTGVHSLLSEAQVPASKVIGLGIGFPGIVDQREGVSVFAPNWGWQNVSLVDLLRDKLKMPFYINNGAQAMALAEAWFGAGQGVDDVAVLLIGTGVGAGILTQGSLYHGTTNSAGEWGHTSVELNGRLCRCGSYGCIEAYVGAPNLIERLRELDPKTSLIHEKDQIKTITAIRDAAEAGDPTAVEILQQSANYIGVGIANIINLFNPQMIIIGGWLGMLLGEYILPQVQQTAERYALKQPFSAAKLTLSKFGDEAISLGAACLALESFLKAEPSSASRMAAEPAPRSFRQDMR